MKENRPISEPLTDWQTLSFDVCATQKGVDRKASVRQGDYRATGRFPVVDQGAGLVAGFTDMEELVHTDDLPLILFGDHTRTFKFLDFPFATGADGTKLLRANDDVVDPKFLYYALLHQEIPGRGYSRHFRYLRDRSISLPIHRHEQRTVSAVLSKLQAAVELQDRIVATLKELKAATMAKLFREGLRGEPLKQTEIGEIPESWGITSCESLCDTISVGIVVTPAKYYVPRGIPCLRSFNIQEDRLLERRLVFISDNANDLHGKSKLRKDDVVIVRTGYPGTACVIPDRYDGTNCIDLLFARPNRERVLSDYLARFINSAAGKKQILAAQGGLAQQHLNVSALKTINIALPSLEEQRAISRAGQLLDSRILMAESSLGAWRAVFRSMLQLLMTGRVHVRRNNLEGSAVEGGQSDHSNDDLKAIELFLTELAERFEPERVILFGDSVPGSPRVRDGVGLLVEMPFRGLARDQAARIAREIPHDFSLDLLVRQPEELRRAREIGDRYLGGILERGRVLYARPPGAPAREPAEPEAEAPRRPPQVLSEATLQELVRRIVEAAAPDRIILFGSAARGDMGPDSDIDLLVVKSCPNRREVARAIRRQLVGVAPGLPKDIVVVTPEDVERDQDTIGYIIRPALREGRVVYAA